MLMLVHLIYIGEDEVESLLDAGEALHHVRRCASQQSVEKISEHRRLVGANFSEARHGVFEVMIPKKVSQQFNEKLE